MQAFSIQKCGMNMNGEEPNALQRYKE